MNIPLSVQADAFQVLLPAQSTDYYSTIFNVVSVLVAGFGGVYAGHYLAKKERLKERKEQVLSESLLGIQYTQGMMSAQYNSLVMILSSLNRVTEISLMRKDRLNCLHCLFVSSTII